MNVEELKQKLDDYGDHLEVRVDHPEGYMRVEDVDTIVDPEKGTLIVIFHQWS